MKIFFSILDVFEECWILTEKQQLKPRILNSLNNFIITDIYHDPQSVSLVMWNKHLLKVSIKAAQAGKNRTGQDWLAMNRNSIKIQNCQFRWNGTYNDNKNKKSEM